MSSNEPTDEALEIHAEACASGEAGYLDPESGLFVMTSVYLSDQGACCGSGCRHCPFSKAEQRAAGRPKGAPAWPWSESADP
ncbi:MAG: DUF5522 domain-containing protein [Myxococcota bacterium]